MAAKDSTEKKARKSAYHKAWRAANKEKVKADAAAYYKLNKERMNSAGAERYRTDPNSYKDRAARWAKENKERRQEISDDYRNKHRDRYRELGRISFQRHRDKRLPVLAEYRAKNGARMRELRVAWAALHPEAVAHHVGLRRTRKMKATPAWADLAAIKAIYKRAATLRKETGGKWHVDHEVPLKHPRVCGLHNEFNLRVIPARENHEKKNKFVI